MNGLFGAGPGFVFIVVAVAFWVFSSLKILNEYERAVVFRLGRLLGAAKGPGLVLIWFAPETKGKPLPD